MGVHIHIFYRKWDLGASYLKCESENVKNTLSSFFIYSENTNSNFCCPLLRLSWRRQVQHKLELWHDEYTFVIDSGHFLFQFANRLFYAQILALVHFNGILSKYVLKEIEKRPLLRLFWRRQVQHKLEFWHDEYTFVIDSCHFLFRFANRLFYAQILALVHFNGILSKYVLKEIEKRNTW